MRIMMEDTKLPQLGRNSHLVTLAPSGSPAQLPAVVGYPKGTWAEGHRSYIESHHDRYLQRLAVLRETLLREKDQFMSLQLPKSTDKHTGFWEAVMTDIAEKSGTRRLHNKQNQAVFGNSATDEHRRGHLERLRRIRIMQNKRRLPPQLEPLQGIGLGAKKNGKTKGSKRTNTSEPTATTYHVNWMRGDHVITPLANSDEVDKAISSWTLKHLRTVDTAPYSNMQSDLKFPSDIRELLRRTRRSIDPSIAQPYEEKSNKEIRNDVVSPIALKDDQSEQRKSEDSLIKEKETKRSKNQLASSRHSINSSFRNFTPPPPPASSPTPILSTYAITPSVTQSVRSSAKSLDAAIASRNRTLVERSTVDGYSDDEEDTELSNRRFSKSNSRGSVEIVDRATSPIGFRVSQFESESHLSLSPTKSKRHIVVKIPHGVK